MIRHVQDFGAILLFDLRYMYQSNKSQISAWLRDRIKVPDRYTAADLQLRAFYQKMAHKGFKPKVEQLEQLRVEFDDANSTGENQGALPQ